MNYIPWYCVNSHDNEFGFSKQRAWNTTWGDKQFLACRILCDSSGNPHIILQAFNDGTLYHTYFDNNGILRKDTITTNCQRYMVVNGAELTAFPLISQMFDAEIVGNTIYVLYYTRLRAGKSNYGVDIARKEIGVDSAWTIETAVNECANAYFTTVCGMQNRMLCAIGSDTALDPPQIFSDGTNLNIVYSFDSQQDYRPQFFQSRTLAGSKWSIPEPITDGTPATTVYRLEFSTYTNEPPAYYEAVKVSGTPDKVGYVVAKADKTEDWDGWGTSEYIFCVLISGSAFAPSDVLKDGSDNIIGTILSVVHTGEEGLPQYASSSHNLVIAKDSGGSITAAGLANWPAILPECLTFSSTAEKEAAFGEGGQYIECPIGSPGDPMVDTFYTCTQAWIDYLKSVGVSDEEIALMADHYYWERAFYRPMNVPAIWKRTVSGWILDTSRSNESLTFNTSGWDSSLQALLKAMWDNTWTTIESLYPFDTSSPYVFQKLSENVYIGDPTSQTISYPGTNYADGPVYFNPVRQYITPIYEDRLVNKYPFISLTTPGYTSKEQIATTTFDTADLNFQTGVASAIWGLSIAEDGTNTDSFIQADPGLLCKDFKRWLEFTNTGLISNTISCIDQYSSASLAFSYIYHPITHFGNVCIYDALSVSYPGNIAIANQAAIFSSYQISGGVSTSRHTPNYITLFDGYALKCDIARGLPTTGKEMDPGPRGYLSHIVVLVGETCITALGDPAVNDLRSGIMSRSPNIAIGDNCTFSPRTGIIRKSCPIVTIGDSVVFNPHTGTIRKSR